MTMSRVLYSRTGWRSDPPWPRASDTSALWHARAGQARRRSSRGRTGSDASQPVVDRGARALYTRVITSSPPRNRVRGQSLLGMKIKSNTCFAATGRARKKHTGRTRPFSRDIPFWDPFFFSAAPLPRRRPRRLVGTRHL